MTTRTQHNIEDEYAMDVPSRKRDVFLYKTVPTAWALEWLNGPEDKR